MTNTNIDTNETTTEDEKLTQLNYALQSINNLSEAPVPSAPKKVSYGTKSPSLCDENGVYHSNAGIFADNAPGLWQIGLPVMPLRPRSKEAFIWGWQSLKERMPTHEEQVHWLHNYMDNNIGLPLGPQSGCVAVDIDTTDAKLIEIIQKICGYSPWERIGSKGKVLLYKYKGQKGCKIKDFDGKMICEILSSGNQIVLPPSIHPNTQAPYHSNVPIQSAIPYLKELPENVETLLRNAFQDAGIKLSHSGWTRATDYVSQGSRDVKMTAIAGLFANGVTRGELTLLEAMDRLRAWKATCVENVAGDDIDIEKGIRNLIQFLIQDVTGPKGKVLPIGWDTGLTEKQKTDWGLNFTEDHKEWTVSQILQYLQAEFEKFEDENDPHRDTSIDFALQRICKSPSLTSLDIDRVLTYIKESNKKTCNKPALRARLNELRKGALAGTDHTELAHAAIEEVQRSGELKFYQDNFWQWKGSNWEILPQNTILRIIANTFGTFPACRKNSDHWGIYQIMKSLVPNEDLNVRKIRGVNFANGFVNEDGEILPHHKDYGSTYTLPYRYLPELANQHPLFDKFLFSVWGHCKDYKERVRALREVICATFFGMGPSFARAVLLYGIAGSGKSQLLDVVRYLMPPNTVTYVTPYKFDDKYEVTELSNSLMNVCGELNETKPIPGAQFKSIVDGSSLQGQFKYGKLFSFSPIATHWFASNYLPKTKDASEGFNRRWLVFSFDRPVRKEDKVRDIGQLIAVDEREGIASWAVSICKELSRKGDYTIPPSHREIMSSIACENDTVFFFLTSDEGPRTGWTGEETQLQARPNPQANQTQTQAQAQPNPQTDSTIQAQQLYEKYSSFCYAVAHAKPVGLRMFLMRLKELGTFMDFRLDGLTVIGLTMK
jgi:phage/plasmid-associated DNA primase